MLALYTLSVYHDTAKVTALAPVRANCCKVAAVLLLPNSSCE